MEHTLHPRTAEEVADFDARAAEATTSGAAFGRSLDHGLTWIAWATEAAALREYGLLYTRGEAPPRPVVVTVCQRCQGVTRQGETHDCPQAAPPDDRTPVQRALDRYDTCGGEMPMGDFTRAYEAYRLAYDALGHDELIEYWRARLDRAEGLDEVFQARRMLESLSKQAV